MLVSKLVAFGRDGRAVGSCADTSNRPGRSAGSRYPPQSVNATLVGGEHDFRTIRCPTELVRYPPISESQTLWVAPFKRHNVQIRHHSSDNRSHKSQGRSVGRKSRSIVDVLS